MSSSPVEGLPLLVFFILVSAAISNFFSGSLFGMVIVLAGVGVGLMAANAITK